MTPGNFPFSANVASTEWNIYTRQNIDNNWGETVSIGIAQAYNAGSSTWQVPYFPPQKPTFCGSGGVTPTSSPCPNGTNILTLSPFPTGITTNNVLVIYGGTGATETVPITNVNAGANQITITTANTHSVAWTIQDVGWIGCFTRTCNYTASYPKINQYTQGLIAIGSTPTAAVIEQDRNTNARETYLYVIQPSSGQWSALGSTILNINAIGSGTSVNSATIATDGTNPAACWSEQINNPANLVQVTTTPQIQCSKWSGSSWVRMGSASLSQSTSDWAYNPSLSYYAGAFYVAFTERSITGWPNLYVKVFNSGSNTWSIVGSGSLNANTSTGIAYHPSLATDGTTLYLAHEEQSAIGQNALGYINATTGSVWSTLASSIAASPSSGSIEDIGIVAVSGTVTAVWTEILSGTLRQTYSQQFPTTTPTFSAPLTVTEALIPGTNGFAGLNRTNDPLTLGIPIPDATGLTVLTSLGLTGASAGQFTAEAYWPDGNIKWVKIRAVVPSVTAGGTVTLTLNNSGSGNFGGANMATDNGSTITISTNGGACGAGSAICFTVKKSNFDLIDALTIGPTTIVSSGASSGVVVWGPPASGMYPANVTCLPTSGGAACTTLYTSANDGANSTCAIAENGPAVVYLKCSSDLNDGSGNVYMHQTTYMYFYQGRSQVKYSTVLRNADFGTSSTFATASKGYQGFELRIVPNISGTLTYQIAKNSGIATGTTSGTDSTYLYQAESQLAEPSGYCASKCHPYSTISGWAIMHNGGSVATGSASQYVAGWADIADGSGVGVLIGQDQLAAYGNESLEFQGGGSDVRIGMWAAENNTLQARQR